MDYVYTHTDYAMTEFVFNKAYKPTNQLANHQKITQTNTIERKGTFLLSSSVN